MKETLNDEARKEVYRWYVELCRQMAELDD